MRVALTWLLGCMVVSGCAEHPPAVIEDRSSAAERAAPEIRRATQVSMSERGELPMGPEYIVQPGDTLYAIAFRLGMDYRELAALNEIEAPYVIRVGETLATEAPAVLIAVAPASSGVGARGKETTANSISAGGPNTERGGGAATAGKGSKASAETASEKAMPPQPAPAAPAIERVSASKPAPQSQPKPPAASLINAPVDRWGWPAKGRITRSFAEDVHKGIDLAGARGDPVRASAAGVVVYAGTGVSGYGALIIVKHNDTYLSAYGHNDELLAAEGEQVSAGKLIARMGSTGTDSVKLHFEIRRNGRPINPATLLSSR